MLDRVPRASAFSAADPAVPELRPVQAFYPSAVLTVRPVALSEPLLDDGDAVSGEQVLLRFAPMIYGPTVLFALGVVGVLVRRNVLIIFMSVEMMLNAVNLTFAALSKHFLGLNGQVFVLMAMVVAAAEVAVGLAIVMTVVRHQDTTNIEDVNLLKG